MSAFTPGPWQMSGIRSTSPSYKGHSVGPDGDPVVIVPYNDRDHHECLANARLIAAAPELLEALKALLNEHDGAGSGKTIWAQMRDFGDAIDLARAALAKAEPDTLPASVMEAGR